ncbi:MAG: SDR family oxidoreductase [Acidimicrobiales bacterium]|nr:SDR family oxidoreductase [Acidimicrobiales bacterium]
MSASSSDRSSPTYPPVDDGRWNQPLLTDRVAVVTGGAGAIGGAVCALFAAQGADVVVADVDADRTEEVAAHVRGQGRRALPVVADLMTDDGLGTLTSAALDTFGRVDIVVNALGHALAPAAAFEATSPQLWDDLYRVNLRHVFATTHAFLPGMRERGWGRIVNFSSVEGKRAAPGLAPYTAFKAGVDAFTQSLAVDVAGDGVTVNSVAVDKTLSYQVGYGRFPEEYDRMVPVWVPAGRYGQGPDIAAVVLFLASDLGAFVVGQSITADGGCLAAGGWYRTPARWVNSPLLVQYYEDDPEAAAAARPATLR